MFKKINLNQFIKYGPESQKLSQKTTYYPSVKAGKTQNLLVGEKVG